MRAMMRGFGGDAAADTLYAENIVILLARYTTMRHD